ncbi:short-chain dehydrogenases/reductase [Cubamyces sp. BRFM 1775]|nr:short-chain dehydrogenases/reductase [Cubamyces sp. BRFM 1775]
MPSYVITGASRGIGDTHHEPILEQREFVNQLSQDPKNIVFGIVRNLQSATKLHELQKSRPNVHVLQADITDVPSLKAAAAEVAKVTGGSLDYLINNAAQVFGDRIALTLSKYSDEKQLEDDLVDAFRTNVVGVVHTTNAFLPLLRKGTAKKVVSLSTPISLPEVTLVTGFAAHSPYCVSKAALNQVVTKYAAELREEGFTFLAISPGVVNTAEKPFTPEELEFFQDAFPKFMKASDDWDGNPLSPETSVELMLGVIDKVTVKDSGAFLSHWGNQKWL